MLLTLKSRSVGCTMYILKLHTQKKKKINKLWSRHAISSKMVIPWRFCPIRLNLYHNTFRSPSWDIFTFHPISPPSTAVLPPGVTHWIAEQAGGAAMSLPTHWWTMHSPVTRVSWLQQSKQIALFINCKGSVWISFSIVIKHHSLS